MTAGISSYPLSPSPEERRQIHTSLQQIYDYNVAEVKAAWVDIRTKIMFDTGSEYLAFESFNLLVPGYEPRQSPPYSWPIIEAVLLVAARFGWNPDEILTLWQIEGLPKWIQNRLHTTGGSFVSLKSLYNGRSPQSRTQAQALARSAMLWAWWGLDILTPVLAREGDDNQLVYDTARRHDSAFRAGFQRELSQSIEKDPMESLTKDCIELKQYGQEWSFRPKPNYQATLLALQHARFKFVATVIPPEMTVDGANVSLRAPFAALIYIYFNSKAPDARVREMIREQIVKRRGKKNVPQEDQRYSSDDLYRAFIEEKAPLSVINWIKNHCPYKRNCHSYINALRFEFLRQVYQILFRGTIGMPAPLLPDEALTERQTAK